MQTQKRRKHIVPVPTSVKLKTSTGHRRRLAEHFVFKAFRAAYGARVHHFFPLLMTLRSDADELLAVLGIRIPGPQALFLEQYLDLPVEQALGIAVDSKVERDAIVEVGNFAVGAAGGGRWLITALTAFLYAAGRDWTVFTCGPELQNAFRRLGVELVDLGEADPQRLIADEQACWGRYYAQHPRVMAANVSQSYRVLSARFEKESALTPLWTRALTAGMQAA